MPISTSNLKPIGITLGDPSGIGPEVTAKAIRSLDGQIKNPLHILGASDVFKKYWGNQPYPVNVFFHNLSNRNFKSIKITPKIAAEESLAYLDVVIDLIRSKSLSGLVTAPLSKESIHLIKPKFVGHTEYLAHAFNVKHVDMMFVAGNFRTVIVTRHIALNQVNRAITSKNILDTIQLTNLALKNYFKINQPKIAVCGLNPHAGEKGSMGTEETRKIIPAIKKARSQKINAFGPFAADTLFTPDKIKKFDAFVAMYHDQGLIPIKTLSFRQAVNLTTGLPFIRTSPAHGTAFDIAGKGIADPASMIEAIRLTAQLCR